MKKLIAALAAALFCAAGAHADEAVNKKCPMSGKDVDAAATTTVSVSVGFCCSKCQGKFDGDKKAQTDAVKKYAGSKDSPANKKCPVSSKDLNKDNTSTASMTVAFCCDKCKAKVDAKPDDYIAKAVKK